MQLNACIRMIEYLQSLPVEKDERRRHTSTVNKDMTEGSTPFSLEVHSTRQLCHFKLLLVNFISTLLSSNRLVEQLVELDEAEKPSLEKLYRKLVETALEYTQSVSRLVDVPLKSASAEQGPNPKFWRALLHRSYDVIDRYIRLRIRVWDCLIFNFSIHLIQSQQFASEKHVYLGGSFVTVPFYTVHPSPSYGAAECKTAASVQLLCVSTRRGCADGIDSFSHYYR